MAQKSSPVTQIDILPISCVFRLAEPKSKDGKVWRRILNLIKNSRGYQSMYWGRQVETPGNVQLHTVRDTLQDHHDFKSSPLYSRYERLLSTFVQGEIITRHAIISEFSSKCASLGKGSPVTGTAIYLSTTPDWDAAWTNWVSIVQHVPGFMGIAGGYMVGPVDGHENAFIALVGWESVEVHDAYHHTQHFRERRRILLDPCKGYNYYGHIAFGSSNAEVEGKAKL